MNKLLPPNASPLELDLETIIADIAQLPVQIRQLWDPETCPVQLLPWLAWAVSVDEWHDAWPEQTQRSAIAASFEIHRYKGTPYSVQRALDSLGISTEIIEWWEPEGSGQPGTMKVLAMVNQNIIGGEGLINAEMLRLATRAIEGAKRGSIHFDLELGIALTEALALAAGVGPGVGLSDTSPESLPVVPDPAGGSIELALGGHSVTLADHAALIEPYLPDPAAGQILLAGIEHRLELSDYQLTGVA